MRVGGGAVNGGPCATTLSTVLLRRTIPISRPRCFSLALSASSSLSSDHASFIKDVAATRPPEHLPCLLSVLRARGETIVSPGARKGLIPLTIPLSESQSGSLTALLRWPTSPPKMEMPVVEVRKYGVWLLAKSVDQYIHRILVEEDVNNSQGSNGKLFDASSIAGEKLYRRGDYTESKIANLDVYLSKKVGLFPDVLERRVAEHLEKGDHVSALVTGEFYAKGHFPGFGRPFVFNAEVLLKFVVVLFDYLRRVVFG